MNLSPRKALNPAFLKLKPHRDEIEDFKANLLQLIGHINEAESEEFHKNLVQDFLKKTYYDPDHFINTKDRKDLVIHTGKKADSPVGVIIEAKSPTNKYEMCSKDSINVKALQELLLYYLRERVSLKNIDLKYLIVTNIHEWFIFNANVFEKLFYHDKSLVSKFEDFENQRLTGKKTILFYDDIAKPFIAKYEDEIEFTYFAFKDYKKILLNDDPKDDTKLIPLYKIFSPEHLLKLPFVNDSNSLDKRFYSEFLHIIGLKEIKQGSKKLIQRFPEGERNAGSLLENALTKLDNRDHLSQVENLSTYGKTREEQLFAVGLELCITWTNRILFLKLLEAQLLSYHKGDSSYKFLNIDRIPNYDELDNLFFAVLAKKQDERSEKNKRDFAHIPYLNSSLFEPSILEHKTLFVTDLRDEQMLPIISSTILKNDKSKKLSGELNAIEYLFKFLDAYDFTSEGKEEIQEEKKTLINASVLGLIFEKINGYKDGSYFTPGFITEYMSRETIRRAVVQKFNEAKGWNCKDLTDIHNHDFEIAEANKIVNSLKICDPAVGSGHFLVSALNEILAIKHELKILCDREGKRLKTYRVEVVNDELIIRDREDGEFFEYHPGDDESQRVQEALFHEKQTIIENCLFGVDINPNSVKICRLRLWIELLKNAYYKNETELETLPNIDINIKCGNSLISRFDIKADLSKALKKSKYDIDSYRDAVHVYQNARNKEEKRAMKDLIEDIKSNFRTEIYSNDPKIKKLYKLQGEIFNLTNQQNIFEQTKKEKAAWEKKLTQLTADSRKLEAEIEAIKNNKIYENAFEWRFEFPEVLDNNGDFIGFDVVIGNPPYMRVQEIQKTQPKQKKYYERFYKNAKASYDLANLFFELAVNISSSDANNAYIFPHKFFNSASTTVFRDYLVEGKYIDLISHFGANMVFEDADTYTCVAQFSNNPSNGFLFQRFQYKSDFQTLMFDKNRYTQITYKMLKKASELYGSNQWILFDSEVGFELFDKIYTNSNKLEYFLEGIFVGLQTSKDDLYVLNKIDNEAFSLKVPISSKTYELETDLFKPFLMGKNVHRYCDLETKKYVFFPYKLTEGKAEIIPINEIQSNYPQTYQYVIDHEKEFKARESGKARKMQHWHAYIYPKNLNKFEHIKLSSMEICVSHPNVTLDSNNLYHPTTVYSWVKKKLIKESYEYLLALANSKLLWWFIKITGDTLQGDARRFKTNYLNPFPLPEHVDKKTEKIISNKVNEIIKLKKQAPETDTTTIESEIDQLIYELYGLSEEEVKVVEGETE
jgi:hypothetical protein